MSLESVFTKYRQHDRQALARLLTLVARGEQVEAIRVALRTTHHSSLITHHSKVIAITGSGGVGKSTLIGKLIDFLRNKGQTVAVLACDPQSPLTGGALLGDRFRMPNRPDDEGVFIRSLAAVSGREAVADHVDVMVQLLAAFGFDVVLLETVGAGQGDTAVRELADVVVLLLQPEMGDDLQWEKAGLLEIADVVVIHKADLPGANRAEAQVRNLLNLPGCREVPVLRASASKGEGLVELWSIIDQSQSRRSPAAQNGRTLLALAQQQLAERFQQQTSRAQSVVERWERREMDDVQAADALLQLLSKS